MIDKEREIRIAPENLNSEFLRVLLKNGFGAATGRKMCRNFHNEQHGWS